MCRSRLRRDVHAFIVRIWHETDDGDESVFSWRGTVDHVRTGKRLYFHDLDTFLRFIAEQAGLRAEEAPLGTDRAGSGRGAEARERGSP